MAVQDFQVEEGNLIVTYESGPPTRIPAADFINAASVPNLNIASLSLLTDLANWVEIVIKTLWEAGLIGEELYETWDLQTILDSLTDDLDTDIGD